MIVPLDSDLLAKAHKTSNIGAVYFGQSADPNRLFLRRTLSSTNQGAG